jgi:hypothetical protein
MDRELRRTLVAPIPRKLSDENAYVQSYACRGHFFAGSREPQHANRFGSCR